MLCGLYRRLDCQSSPRSEWLKKGELAEGMGRSRGGERWWRAPLYGALGAYLVFVLIYFPGVYAGTGAPWINLMVGDFAIKMGLAVAFLPVYGLLRGALRPKGGYGGR
jgi:uncharacterized PurR-regulated membrane protein YhhQ (DUF165 family)